MLILAAPAAAGVLDEGAVLVSVLLAFVSFCLVAAGTYLLNDARDAEADRHHPAKSGRPIAAGEVPLGLAVALGVVLLVAGLATAALEGLDLLGLMAGYVALTSAYTMWLKHVPVLDLAIVASGFIIRAVAGGLAADVPLSRWFLIVASFGSLFVVAGKRHGEHLGLVGEDTASRPALASYSSGYLHYVWSMASAVTVLAYCLWAFEQSPLDSGGPWHELSIVPFVLWILRYAMILDAGRGETPEDIVLGDRALQLLALVWAAVFGCGIYLGD